MRYFSKAMMVASAAFCLNLSAYAQDVSLKVNNVTVKEAIELLKKNTGYSFVFSSSDLNTKQHISVSAEKSSIEDVVNQILKGQKDLNYEIQGKKIVIRKATASSSSINSQDKKQIKGNVVDAKGEPIIGATVVVKGTTNGTVTDFDGNFTLNVPEGAQIEVSYIGFKPYNFQAIHGKSIAVTLKEDTEILEEVVVVGYGVQKKQTMTAAASTLKVDKLESLPSTNLASSLGGRVSGVLIQQTSGEAGYENPNIIIRGASSPTSSAPLIVVDGIIGRGMSQIDPSEIENMTVLKDASAVAPYGARGANGVILITTKRGKEGKAIIDYNFKGGFGEPTRLPKIASSYDHARLMNEAWRNKELDLGNDPGLYGKYTEEELRKFKDGSDLYAYPNTNWLKEVLLPRAWQHQHSLTARGGSDKIKYFVGLGFVSQDALYGNVETKTPSSNFKRYNFRTNIDANLIEKYLNLSADISFRQEERKTIAESTSTIFYNMYRNPQTDPGRFPDGKLGKVSLGYNPIGLVTDGGWSKDKKSVLNTRFVLDLNVPYVDGLNIKGIFSFDKSYTNGKTWKTPVNFYVWNKILGKYDSSSPNREGADLSESFYNDQSYTFETQVSYNKIIKNSHHIGALFVYSLSEGTDNEFWASRYKYKFYSIQQLFAGPDKDKNNGGSASENGKIGSVLRFTYNYKEKYMMELNGRLDGSEKFPSSKRWGFFPSVSFAWRLSEEHFMNSVSFIDNLKLRSSWGKAGTDNIARFQYMSAYGVGSNSVFGGSSPEIAIGYTENRFPNPNITWETSEMFNLGLDASLFRNKLSLEFDFFYKKTSDILRVRTDMPGILGYRLPAANVGVVDNRGVDFSFNYSNSIRDFKYNINGNFTWARNRIIDLLEPDGQKNNPRIRETGHPMGQIFGYEALGLFQSDEEADNWPQPQFGKAKAGDIKYKDQNGDGKIDGEDQVAIGRNQFPELIFGFNVGCEYKGFDFQMFFQGAAMTDFYYGGYLAQPYCEGLGGTLFEHHINNTWTVENPKAEFPRLYYGKNANNAEFSSFWLRNGAYLRLKNIELGYNLKSTLLKHSTFIKGMRIYLSGQNLFTCSGIKYFDPETRSSSGQAYPQMRNYVLGVNVTF